MSRYVVPLFHPLSFDQIHSLSLTESVLFPFGLTAGDELVPPFIPSDPVSKLGFSNLSCPFFGVEEDTLFVSESHMKTVCAVYVWEGMQTAHCKHYVIVTFRVNVLATVQVFRLQFDSLKLCLTG